MLDTETHHNLNTTIVILKQALLQIMSLLNIYLNTTIVILKLLEEEKEELAEHNLNTTIVILKLLGLTLIKSIVAIFKYNYCYS